MAGNNYCVSTSLQTKGSGLRNMDAKETHKGVTDKPQTVILNASLQNGDIHQMLQGMSFCRVRVTEGTAKNSIIFPTKSTAYLVLAITETTKQWPPIGGNFLNEETIGRVQKFYSIHRNSHLLLLARMTTESEFKVFREIQRRFWKSPLIIYPVSSAKQCVKILQQVSTKGTVQKDPAEGSDLRHGKLGEEMAQRILEKNLGVSCHQSLVLLDGCQNIANIACSSTEDLLERSPLPKEVAQRVKHFFEKDCVSV